MAVRVATGRLPEQSILLERPERSPTSILRLHDIARRRHGLEPFADDVDTVS